MVIPKIISHKVYWKLAQNPFTTRTDIDLANYWQESILLPLFAYYAHLTSRLSFNVFCLGTVVLGLVIFAINTRRILGPNLAVLLLGLLLAHPVILVMLSWLGMPDSITFLLTVCLLFVKSFPLIVLVSILGMTNHPMMALIAPSIIMLRHLSERERERIAWRHVAGSLLGLTAGESMVKAFLTAHRIELFSRLDWAAQHNFTFWLRVNLQQLPLTIFSLQNVVWIILVISLVVVVHKDRKYFLVFIAFMGFSYLVTFFNVDTTRVFSLLTWGASIHVIMYSMHLSNGEILGNEIRKTVLLTAVLGLVSPQYYLWAGKVVMAPFQDFYGLLIRILRQLVAMRQRIVEF